MNKIMNNIPLVTLQFDVSPKFLSNFPSDPNSDITIILPYSAKNYSLRKQMLIEESKYFHEFFTNEKTEDWNIILLSKKFDVEAYENILRCFYGAEYRIFSDSEVYSAYQICEFLKISKFLTLIERSLIEDFDRYSFYLVYQLAEVYLLEGLRNRCYSYLETNENAFRISANFTKAKQVFTQQQTPPQILKLPSNLLLLLEEPFKNLIKLHNNYKLLNPHASKKYLSYTDIYKLLKWYVEMRSQNQKEAQDMLRQLVVETIDREILTSKQYHVIYHSELLLIKQQDQFFISDQCETLIGNGSKGSFAQQKQQHQINYIFDPLLSENYLLKKELKEQRNENAILMKELKNVKETLERSIKTEDWFKIQFNKLSEIRILQERIQNLEKELSELKAYDQHRQIQTIPKSNSNMTETIESVFQITEIKQEQSEKQNLIESEMLEQDLESSQISGEKQLIFDCMPESVVELKELIILIDILNLTIFEKVKFTLIFRGSFHGFDSSQLISRCQCEEGQLIFFIRTWEDEKVFGMYLKERFVKDRWIENNQVFCINNKKKLNRKAPVRFGYCNMMIEICEDQLSIANNCANHTNNRCSDGALANSKFQVDEIEVFKISRSSLMSN